MIVSGCISATRAWYIPVKRYKDLLVLGKNCSVRLLEMRILFISLGASLWTHQCKWENIWFLWYRCV